MFGIGVPELIVILFILVPVVALIVFLNKAEKKIDRETSPIIQNVHEISIQLREKKA